MVTKTTSTAADETARAATLFSVSPSGETDISVSPSGETHVSVSSSGETHVSVSPSGETDISVSPSGETHVSVSPSGETDISVSPSSKTLILEPCAGGWALIDRARVTEALTAVFDPAHYGSAAHALRDGRGQAFKVMGSFGTAALRHYRRGGMTGALWQDRYTFMGIERTRCFRELRLLNLMLAHGLPVPAPLAARFVRSGLSYRADILTAWLPGANPLSAHVQSASAADFSAIGQMLARFHGARIFTQAVWHADLNAHNILLTDNGPALIDFDRCKLRAPRAAWQQANLARLLRSLTKLGFAARKDFASELMPALLGAYQLQMVQTR